RPPEGGRLPHDPPAGVWPRGLGEDDGPLLRRDVGRSLRLRRRRRDLVHGGDAPTARALGAGGVVPYEIATMRSIAPRARAAISGSTVTTCFQSRRESRSFSSVIIFM